MQVIQDVLKNDKIRVTFTNGQLTGIHFDGWEYFNRSADPTLTKPDKREKGNAYERIFEMRNCYDSDFLLFPSKRFPDNYGKKPDEGTVKVYSTFEKVNQVDYPEFVEFRQNRSVTQKRKKGKKTINEKVSYEVLKEASIEQNTFYLKFNITNTNNNTIYYNQVGWIPIFNSLGTSEKGHFAIENGKLEDKLPLSKINHRSKKYEVKGLKELTYHHIGSGKNSRNRTITIESTDFKHARIWKPWNNIFCVELLETLNGETYKLKPGDSIEYVVNLKFT